MGAASALARRALADSRARNGGFALLFAAAAAAQVVGYRESYPTRADRIAFARAFGDNDAVRLFYGAPHDLLTVGGYVSWRVGGILSLFAAVWGVLAAVRALRAEEDAGRQELVLGAPVSRRTSLAAAFAAIAIGAALLWLAAWASLVGSGLPAAGSSFLALAIVSPIPAFAGAGAVASQLAGNRRLALALAMGVVAVSFAIRVVADTSTELPWLRWASPLGWVEEMRAFADPRPAVLLLPLALGAALLALAAVLALRRDVGAGLLPVRDTSAPRRRLLSSPTALALRGELGTGAAWLAGVGGFAVIMGIISTSFSTGISDTLRRQIGKLGAGPLVTPTNALGIYFLFYVLVFSLFAASQITMVRHEESEQRLETLLAGPVDRRRWLAGRLLLAAAGATVLALTAALCAWAGAASQDAGVPLARMLEAGANCLPAAFLFLALGALTFAVAPRATAFAAYGLVVGSFIWELVGALLDAPGWTLGLSPFHHVALVPAEAFRPLAAATMLVAAAAVAGAAIAAFGRRDLAGP